MGASIKALRVQLWVIQLWVNELGGGGRSPSDTSIPKRSHCIVMLNFVTNYTDTITKRQFTGMGGTPVEGDPLPAYL